MPTRSSKLSVWTCAACGRQFARAKQSHSCKPQSVGSHFAGKDPALRELFDLIVGRLEKTGDVRADAVQSSIHLIGTHPFAGVQVRREYLRISFLSQHPIDSPRITGRLVLGPRRVEHVVLVRGKNDVKGELLKWLADAQRMQSR
jgi:hypothetical protein